MQCNLERSEDKARWHVSRGAGPAGGRAGGATRGLGGLWEPTTPFCLHSSLCFWCWRTGCTGSSLTTCSQVGRAGTRRGRVQLWAQAVASHLCPAPACAPAAADSAQDLATELVYYGFVHEVCGPTQPGWEGDTADCASLSPHASLPHCRMTGPSWLPSWKAPSSSTSELSHDLAPQPPGDQPWQPTWGSSALAQGSGGQGLTSAYMLRG